MLFARRPLHIQLYKLPRSKHYNWRTQIVFEDDYGILCHLRGPRTLNHQTKGRVFTFKTDVLEFYWKNRGCSLHCSREPASNQLHYYSNIHSHPEITADSMAMIDFDLDVVKNDTNQAKVIDEHEFIRHTRKLRYSGHVQSAVPVIADYVRDLLNTSALFAKPSMLALFATIEREQAQDLTPWTKALTEASLPELLPT